MATVPTIATATDIRLGKPVTVKVHASRREDDGVARLAFEVGTRVVVIETTPAFVVAVLATAVGAAEREYSPEPTGSPS